MLLIRQRDLRKITYKKRIDVVLRSFNLRKTTSMLANCLMAAL